MALTAPQALEVSVALYEKLAKRRPEIVQTERYFGGKQPLTFASPEWAKFHQSRYSGFSDNWCGVVGSAPAERTVVDGFLLGSDPDAISADEQALWADWERLDGPAQSSQGFQTSTVSKRSFALVWGDSDDEPTLSWEHPLQVIVTYDDENRRIRKYALKSWTDDDTEFMTLYTPTEVWKWQRVAWSSSGETPAGLIVPTSGMTPGGGWRPRQGDSDDTWPIPNPLNRVPIVEFPNRPSLAAGPVSDITGTMAMQDAINLLWAYLFVAADYASMPARVVLGAQPPKVPVLDDNGNKIGEQDVDIEKLKQGRLLWLTGENAKIGQWDSAKLDVFTNVINIAIKHVAAQTSTPIYLIHGELGNVNGETLTGLDAPLVSKVKAAQKFYTPAVREVFSLMADVRGNTEIAKAARTGQVKWHNPALASDAQIADAAIKSRQVGMPLQSVLESIYGYGPAQVKRILDQVASENADPYLAGQAQKPVA